MIQDKYKKTMVFALCGCMMLPLCAQKTYTLEQCRAMALTHNIKMKKAQTDLKSAEQTKKEAFTNYFPTVGATGAGFNANKGLLEMELSPGMGMSMLKNGIVGSITATQPLFTGGQIINTNKLAKVSVEIGKLQLRQSENEVSYTTEQYYWQVVTLQEKQNTLTAVEKMLNRLFQDVDVAVKAGMTTRNELLQVELKRNDVASKKITLDNALSLSKMILAQYIGEASDNFEVETDVPVEDIPAFPEQLRRNHRASLILTPEYHLLEKNVEANRLQKNLTIGKNLPTVAIGAGYMYDDLMDKSHPFGIAFATVSIPISNWWGGSHAIKRQKLQLKYAEYERDDTGELLMIKMQKAWNDVDDSYKQILIARKSIEQATENLRLNEDYYKAGTTSMSDLLDAQSMFQQSRDAYVDAYSHYQIRKLEYLQATGR
ncbi:TolC family protein [Bacteroides sp. GM023]|uniref:TolC family protein n=1 Tax=Bacteroides sp. GM023 TaxID=2723058 RepID=UPI00168C04B3|nr:TolC family protein [Bacteroides sp. GM023]MBD3588198.1 TolC family protein [Bacteroides sp. GM023]